MKEKPELLTPTVSWLCLTWGVGVVTVNQQKVGDPFCPAIYFDGNCLLGDDNP